MRKRGKKKISVVISGMPSVGKTTAANTIAEKFGLRHIAGGDLLREIATERGYNPCGPDWWDTSEGMRFMVERKKDPEFDKKVDQRLAELVESGGVVITSYPIPWLVRDAGLKLWFQASQKTRAKRLSGRDSIPAKLALEIVKKRDFENSRLYKQVYGIDFGNDLTPFNYVLNTEKMSAEEVAKASCKLVSNYVRYSHK